jgi:acyl-homoserine-lactone acylase
MKRRPIILALVGVLSVLCITAGGADEVARWQQRARNVTIIRDNWGIPHVYGKTDADAVFGFLYAQAEDDFPRIELNYIDASGRRAEVEGEGEIYRDLRMKLFIDPADMRAKYAESPEWLRALMDAFADGLNYYLHTHPAVKPKLITRFDPWMALSFSEGSIGGDIESISLRDLDALYGQRAPGKTSAASPEPVVREPKGSNGFAIAPSRSASGHALLLINPHTTFYFRPEVHVISEQGLNAYGAVTWGQFFVYQGFSDRAGWMHTSGGADVIDEYMETVINKSTGVHYKYGDGARAFITKKITVPYKQGGALAEKTFTAYYSHHGPIVREAGGKWISVRLMQEPIKALTQSYLRTKAKNYAELYRAMELRTNSSNNTVYADADGNIAYFHGNFVPIRDPKFDWTNPVDGSDPATEWKGLHPINETITLFNPPSGWIQNTNNGPFSAAGPYSPRAHDYPAYMSVNPENPRGINAVRVLSRQTDFTLDRLIAAAYDPTLSAFEKLIPALLKAYEETPPGDVLKTRLADPIAMLRGWDFKCSVRSVPTSLACFWGQDLLIRVGDAAKKKGVSFYDFIANETTAKERLEALARAVEKLEHDFGTWKTPWGEISRFQRLSGEVKDVFDDAKPSLPVGFASATWGSLAAFGTSTAASTKTKKIYGTRGNSFVAVVEFGPRIKAKSILAGGVSGDPLSLHFNDQAELYAMGQFKDVLYYRDDVERKAERIYRPGE